MLAALRAARRMPAFPLVRVVFSADWWRDWLARRRATVRACIDKFVGDAAEWASRLNAFKVARERTREGLRFAATLPFCASRRACSHVLAEVPRLGEESANAGATGLRHSDRDGLLG